MAKQIEIDLLIKTAKSVKSTEAQRAVLLDIYEALKKVEKGSTAFDTLTAAADELKQSLGGVNASFEDIYGDIQPLTTRLGELEDRMYELALAGQQNTQEFKDLQAEAIRMRKTIIDVDASVDAFAQKGAKIKALGQIVTGLAGAFGTAQAAVGLLGGDTGKFEKSMLKLQQVMTIMQGVQEITNLMTEKNIILEGLANLNRKIAIRLVGEKTVATAAEAVATGTATVAQRALNLAMSANPIGLLIVAVGTLIGLYSAFGDETEDVTSKTDALTKKLEDQQATFEANNKQYMASVNARKVLNTQYANEQALNAEAELEVVQKQIALIDAKTDKTTADYNKIKALKADELEAEKKLQRAKNSIYEEDLKATKATIDNDVSVTKEKKKNLEKLMKENEKYIHEILTSGESYTQEEIKQFDQVYHQNRVVNANMLKDLEATLKEQEAAQAATNRQMAQVGKVKTLEIQKIENKYTIWFEQELQRRLKAEEEARNRRIDQINEELERRKSANVEDRKITDQLIKDKLEREKNAINEQYDDTRDKLIEKATKREIAILEEKFKKGKIDEKTFMKDREDILSKGINNLLAEEKKLLDDTDKLRKERLQKAEDDAKNNKEITVAETKKLNAELAKLEIQRQKSLALSEVKTTTDTGAKDRLKESDEKLKKILDNAKKEEEAYNKQRKVVDDHIAKTKADAKTTDEFKKDEIAATEEKFQANKDQYEKKKVLIDQAIIDAKKENEEAKKNALDEIEAAKKVTAVKNSFKEAEKKASRDLADAELEVLKEKYEKDISNAELTKEEKEKIDAQYAVDKKNIEVNLARDVVSIDEDTVDKKIENGKKELDFKKELADKIISLEKTIADTIMSFIEQETNERLKANDLVYQDKIRRIDAEEEAYNDLVANRTIAEQAAYDITKGFEDQRKNAERQRQLEEDKIKKKAFEAQKINDATQVAINYGVAIAKAFRDFGWPLGLVPAGLLGVQLAAEEAAIINKQYVPQYAKGGIHYGDGPVVGPGTGTSDDINAKLSNGEVVINAKSSKKFAPILSAINEAGGGKKIPHLATGGMVGQSNSPMVVSNNIDLQPLIDAINNQSREVYVKESTVTNAQNNAEKLKRRTRF